MTQFNTASRIPASNVSDTYSPAYSAPQVAPGLIEGTLVDTDTGWRRIETLAEGDRIHTLDGGVQTLRHVQRRPLTAPGRRAPHLVQIPGGVLDNCAPVTLLADHLVLLDLPQADSAHGTPIVLVPAGALQGWCGVDAIEARPGMAAFTLTFDDEEVVFANTGLMAHCPGPLHQGLTVASDFFTVLSFDQTRALLGLAEADEARNPRRHKNAPVAVAPLRLVHAA